MKKLFTCLILMYLFPAVLFCQDEKRFVLGGNCSWEYQYFTNSEVPGKLNFEIMPRFGYLVQPNLIIGTEIDFLYMEYFEDNSYPQLPLRVYQLAAFVRYHNAIAGNLRYFIEPKIGTQFWVGFKDFRYSIVSANMGFMYFIKNSLSIELKILSLNFHSYWMKGSEQRSNYISLDYELITPNIGVHFYF